MDTTPTVAGFAFEEFILDLRRGSLRTTAGQDIPLRRQSFELLRLLLENAGRLLDRDTINRVIWSDIAVTDDSITQCVRDIRRAIGDDAQRILKTVPGAAIYWQQMSPPIAIHRPAVRCSVRLCRTNLRSWCCHSRT